MDQDEIHIGIIAPAAAVRAGLRSLLSGEPGLRVVVESAQAGVLASLSAPPEVVVMLLHESAPDDLETLRALAEPPAVLMLASNLSEAALPAGGPRMPAWGILPLEASPEELAAAVRAVHEGLLVGTPGLLQPLLTRRAPAQEEGDLPMEALTPRENQILQLLAEGLANKQIAAALGISEHTVKYHISSIYSKLGAVNRTEAVRTGIRNGWIVV